MWEETDSPVHKCTATLGAQMFGNSKNLSQTTCILANGVQVEAVKVHYTEYCI